MINIVGLGCVVGFAYLVSWLKSSPWQAAAANRTAARTAAVTTKPEARTVPLPAE